MSSQYKCPKCGNILLSSNKILHDLKCTEKMPATYDNIINQNIFSSLRMPNSNIRLSGTNANNLSTSGLKKGISGSPFKSSSIVNKDGTTTEIKLEKSISGKVELLETTYDPQGNVITRKKAESGNNNTKLGFHEIKEFKSNDEKDNYNIYEGGNVFLQTVPREEQEKNKTNDPNKNELNKDKQNQEEKKIESTPPQPIEHNYGKHGYTWMQNNINTISVNIDDIRNNKVNNINVPSINEDLNKYFNMSYNNGNNYSTAVSNNYNNYNVFSDNSYNYNTNVNVNNSSNLNNNNNNYNYNTNYDNVYNNNNYNNITTNYNDIFNYNNTSTSASTTNNNTNNNNVANFMDTNYSNNYTTNTDYNFSYDYNQNNSTNNTNNNFNQNEFLANYNNSNVFAEVTSINHNYNKGNDSDINYSEFKFPGFI
jgi:hypothetical protein